MSRFPAVRELAEREFQTVLRTPVYWVLAAGALSLVLGLSWLNGATGYLPLALDLTTPLEALVPVLAFAFGYRAILGDRERGELETLRTYPISGYRFVAGVYLGRALALLGVLVVGLLAAGGLVAVVGGGDTTDVIAAHGTVDTPLVLLRLLVLTAGFALVVLAVALAVSAAARSTRSGLVLATVLAVLLVVGLDAVLVGGLTAGVLPPAATTALSALSPNSAFRALVFALAVGPVGAVDLPAGPGPVAAGLGLALWLAGSLLVAARLAWR